MDDHEPPTYADRLRARAEATDRSARFEDQLAEVARLRDRRHRRRRWARAALVVVAAGAGALAPVVGAALTGAEATGRAQVAGACVGVLLGIVAPLVRDRLARRRGAVAWDWHRERYVLIGNPSTEVRDLDRPTTAHGGPPLPPPRG